MTNKISNGVKLLVVNVAGLSPALLKIGNSANLSRVIKNGAFAVCQPIFPAVTCPAQASLTTGLYPNEHGIVANGIFERDSLEVHFWHQPSYLVKGERFWTKLRKQTGKDIKVAMLFWQHSKFTDADFINTPQPIHTEMGGVIPTCYSKPYSLYHELEKEFGQFPLHYYWGPFASPESSKWIAKATKFIVEKFSPDITLTYIPHLDYSLQRFGSNSKEVLADVGVLDAIIGELSDLANKKGIALVILSEYGIGSVSGAIPLNKIFRQEGLLAVREIKGKEYVEIGDSRAFAVVDHQIAHIYLHQNCVKQVRANDISDLEVANMVRLVDRGITVLATDEEKREFKIDNKRSGDIVAIAPRNKWFSYEWWLDRAKAPTYTYTVDIHRKPGYDPLDLFFAPDRKGIATDTNLIKGSHGRLPDTQDEMALFISSVPLSQKYERINTVEVPTILSDLFCKSA